MTQFVTEQFDDDERAILERYFSNVDKPVFALVNLPEVVKGALFARYSRSPKSLRRLFLDEFAQELTPDGAVSTAGLKRAEALYQRIFLEYGDDSVAQLGGVHLAVEQASQPLVKVLEWGRLAAYLEQSTRYVPYDDQPGGWWRCTVPPEIEGTKHEASYRALVDLAFQTYRNWLGPLQDYYRKEFPQDPGDADFVYNSSIRAKACDVLRGLLPIATRTNVGIYATGQSYEQLLLRMRAHPLQEVRDCADMMLVELRKVIPAFLTRVDRPDRGGEWSAYLSSTKTVTRSLVARLSATVPAGVVPPGQHVELCDYDEDGEIKVAEAILCANGHLSHSQARVLLANQIPGALWSLIETYVGKRNNRRHKPGRAFEATSYRFEVVCDIGAFRDLQRHRMLTIEWQDFTPSLGWSVPVELMNLEGDGGWRQVMEASANLYHHLMDAGLAEVAPYALSMAYRVRFFMEMNAREAMHLIELRSGPQGHPSYRRVAQQMHNLISEVHPLIGAAMKFADHSEVDLARLAAERRAEARRQES